LKRKRELEGTSAAAAAAAAATAVAAAKQSWAVRLAQQPQVPAAASVAAAKSSWAAALQQRQSPSHQQQQQQGATQPVSAAAAQPAQPAQKKTPPAVLDLAPPGYAEFASRPPRAFAPVSSKQQYLQYSAQYESQYAMYISLHKLIEANIASVRAMHEQMAAAALGSPAHVERQAALRHMLQTKAPLTQRWNAAFKTLHEELQQLHALLQAWVAAGAGSALQQQQQDRYPVAMANGHSGKGLMLASAAAGMQPAAALVGA
jgi:hypothetical protein